ncbi:MAG: hypothetical protein FWC91_11030 [Defluviitaleaceae bacterium]|nr:hypothetical protein [Defluviitaleaceae bacterium]
MKIQNETKVEIEITPKLKEKLQEYTQLYDFYGSLLTERQNTCFTLHFLEDFSLAEIGTALEITPQAVADQIKRTVKILRKYEEKLGFIQSWHNQQDQLNHINDIIDSLIKEECPDICQLKKIKAILTEM